MSSEQFPDRPDHEDFWYISQAVVDSDAESDAGAGAEQVLGKFADIDSVTYMARQRVLRGAPEAGGKALVKLLTSWLDGFTAGARYQWLKQRKAQEWDDA